jgi:hypothetical protein
MPIQLELDWGRKRRFKEQEAAARDIILNCKSVPDETVFAAKYKMSTLSVKNIRLGLRWKKLRSELEGKQ